MIRMYSVRDEAAQFFLPPFFARTDSEAQRMFLGSLGESFPFRRDYSLFFFGVFDQDNGTLTASDPKIVLAGVNISEEMDPRPKPSWPAVSQEEMEAAQ